jgi:hypothetical protein
MTHKMTSYLNSQKRHHAVEECIEAFFKYLTESDEYESEHRKTYLAKMKGLKNRNQVEQIDTMAMKNYLAGARSIVNLNPPVSASSLLENAVYHSSDTEALLSDWGSVNDDLWSAYFNAEYATLTQRNESEFRKETTNQ